MNFPRLDLETAAALRADLAAWTVDAVAEILGERAVAAVGREQLIPAIKMVSDLDKSGDFDPKILTLTKLFTLGLPVTASELEPVFTELSRVTAVDAVSALTQIGLVSQRPQFSQPFQAQGNTPGTVHAIVDLRPISSSLASGEVDWWVVADLGEAITSAPLRADHVLGIGGASATLAQITIRKPVKRVLDLGTGCGVQALHALSHAHEVVATDISERALGFAEFNKLLNYPESNWTIKAGSLFEPVVGDKFDLIVSNPPFVITPPNGPQYEYRNTDFAGDNVMSELVIKAGEFLVTGGVMQMLGNWEIINHDWTSRWQRWLAAAAEQGHFFDAWVVQRDVQDPAEYAEVWLRDAGLTNDRSPEEYRQGYEAYLTDFDTRGVQAIGFGMVLLRKRDTAEVWHRFEEFLGPLQMPLGEHLQQVLANHDLLASLSDAQLLQLTAKVAADVTEERYYQPGQEHPQHILLRQGGGFGRSLKADTAVAALVAACDGELSLSQITNALAALLEISVSEMEAGLVPVMRELILDGWLILVTADN